MEIELYFKKTILDKVDLNLDKVARILIEEYIGIMLNNFTCNIEDYLFNICDDKEAESILECEENVSKLEEKLKNCLLSICDYESTSNQKG